MGSRAHAKVRDDRRAARRKVLVRETLILLGFSLLVAAAVVTVVVPELHRAPEESDAVDRADATGNPAPSTAGASGAAARAPSP